MRTIKAKPSCFVTAIAGIGVLCLLGIAAAYWQWIYLPQTTPKIPLPANSKLIEHHDWTTSEVYWYSETYLVEMTPQEIATFYESEHVECGTYARGLVDQSEFYLSCSGNAVPSGWFHLEIGSENGKGIDSSRIVVEVGWEAGL